MSGHGLTAVLRAQHRGEMHEHCCDEKSVYARCSQSSSNARIRTSRLHDLEESPNSERKAESDAKGRSTGRVGGRRGLDVRGSRDRRRRNRCRSHPAGNRTQQHLRHGGRLEDREVVAGNAAPVIVRGRACWAVVAVFMTSHGSLVRQEHGRRLGRKRGDDRHQQNPSREFPRASHEMLMGCRILKEVAWDRSVANRSLPLQICALPATDDWRLPTIP